jgi:hypothetical protein
VVRDAYIPTLPSPSSLLPNLIADLPESRNGIHSHSSPSNPRRVCPGWVSPDKTLLWEGKKVPIRRRGEVCVLLFLDLDIDGGSSNQNEDSSAQHAKPVNALRECPGPLPPTRPFGSLMLPAGLTAVCGAPKQPIRSTSISN